MRYLLLTSLIWAFSFGLIGNLLKNLDPILVATSRLWVAFLVFLPLLRLRQLSLTEQCRLLWIGAVQFGLMYVCYISAFRYIPSHLVALFSVLTPLYVVLIHDLIQGQLHRQYLLAAVLSVAGAAVIKADGGESSSIWLGFALMQASGLAFAYGQVAYRKWARHKPEIRSHAVFGFLYLGGALTAWLTSTLTGTTWREFTGTTTSTQLGVILYLGVVASGLGFYFWNLGATRSTPGALAAFNNAVVPLAILVSLFVFGEIKSASTGELLRLFLGAVLILAAVLLGQKQTAED